MKKRVSHWLCTQWCCRKGGAEECNDFDIKSYCEKGVTVWSGKKIIVFWVCMFLCSSYSSSVKPLFCEPASVTLASGSAKVAVNTVAVEVTLWCGTLFISCFDIGNQLSSSPYLSCSLFTWILNFCLFAWFPKNHQHAPLSSSPVSQVRLTASRWPGAAMASLSVRTTVMRRTAQCALRASSSVRVGSA